MHIIVSNVNPYILVTSTQQCYLVYPKCRRHRRKLEEGRKLSEDSDDPDLNAGWYDKHGNWHEWDEDEAPDAHTQCLIEKTKVEMELPKLQFERALSPSCKLFMKHDFGVGCVNMGGIGNDGQAPGQEETVP